MLTKAVKYNPSDARTQALLRLALFEAWDGRCHWCGREIENATFQEIDHIIPRSRYEELRAEYIQADERIYKKEFLDEIRNLPRDKDDVANLAPICAAGPKCNQKKAGLVDDYSIGAISGSLKRAAQRSERVTARVQNMLAAQGLERHLVGLVSLPDNESTRTLIHTYGPLVLDTLWRADEAAFETFRVPAEILLRVDVGEIPDFFSDATRSGTGVDGLLRLSHAERIALGNSQILFGVDAVQCLSEGISLAIDELDAEVIDILENVTDPGVEGPRWLSVASHNFEPGEQPIFEVELSMETQFGGDAIVGTDNDGQPRHHHRAVKARASLTCRLSLNDGEFSHSFEWEPVDPG